MRALVVLLVAGACGRVGFDARSTSGDGAISDGDGSGSGSAAAFVPPWHSGPRLRARLMMGGGDPIFYGWHDRQLDSDCQPTIASDGMERCMPFRARADSIYSDAACSQPLALVYNGTCGKDTYAFLDSGGTHEYPIGAPYGGTIYAKTPSCASTSLPSSQAAYSIGAEEPASTFVASTYSRHVVGAYEHSFNDFSDGATIDIGVLELPTTSCEPFATELGAMRCRTGAKRATHAYADAGCTQPILAWERTQYDPPSASLLEVFPPQACDSTYTLYQTVANVTAPQYWVKGSLGCSQITTAANVVLYTATAIADPAPLGTITRGPDRGRIGTFYWTGPDNVAIPLGPFDQQLGLPCTPFNAADGVLRCVPSLALSEMASQSAGCAGSISTIYGACFGPPPVDGPDYSSCTDGPYHIHALPQTFSAASLFDDGSCVSIPLPGGTGYDASVLGAEVPPATFPALIETVE